ncbi:MAG: VanZ family protein [Thermodesulfovibrionales bacterium]
MSRGLLLILWLFAVLIFSIIPSPETDVGPENLDKLIHFIIYGITAILFLRFFSERYQRDKLTGPASIVAASFYGLMMEIFQSFLPYRSFSLSDMLSNLLGAAVFVTLWNIILFIRNS